MPILGVLFWFGASSAIYDWVSWRPLGGRRYLYRWAETQKSFNLVCHHKNQDNKLGTSDTLKIWFYLVLMQFKSHSYLRKKKTLVWNFKCFSAMFLNSVFNLLFHFHLCIEKDISQMTIETKPVVLLCNPLSTLPISSLERAHGKNWKSSQAKGTYHQCQVTIFMSCPWSIFYRKNAGDGGGR